MYKLTLNKSIRVSSFLNQLFKFIFYFLETTIGAGVGVVVVIYMMSISPDMDLGQSIILGSLIILFCTVLGIYLFGLIYVKLFLPEYDMTSGIISCIIGIIIGVPVALLALELINDYASNPGFWEIMVLLFPIVGAVVGFNLGLRNTSSWYL